MSLTDRERDELRLSLERMPDSILGIVRENAERLLRDLKDMNSSPVFGATQQLLEARGLTHVSQLDREGTAALTAHLERTLALLRN